MAFVEELANHGENARVVATATEPRVDFTQYFAEPQPGTLIYACGPERLLQAIEDAAKALTAGSVRLERFAAREFDDAGDMEFEVEFVDSGVTAAVPVVAQFSKSQRNWTSPLSHPAPKAPAGRARQPYCRELPTTATRS